MNVKALKTQLMGAVAMVIVAAVALSSSTYAWFAMNNQVKATGMQVQANTDSAYLLIDGDHNLSDATSTFTWSEAVPLLMPANYRSAVTNATNAKIPDNWYTAVSDDPAMVASNVVETALKSNNFTQYVLVDTLYIGFKEGTATGNYTISASATVTDADYNDEKTDIGAVSVLLASGNTVLKAGTTMDELGTLVATAGPMEVDVYIYYDGTHSTVYSNNAANLSGAKIDLDFTSTAVATQSE